ncbi:uncharacterized PE-PGRS family protein PE_PGRS54-like [Mercenaria mercenaria]|uniref:uncharacterized PE-PGRS family protein PE_PGRS54-like n=1 Tax=Mercenaria mercenaria TaxID=6596 RepID=UPI00234F928B|nr:uncharacterized PE-PGRS family protein PE_PGRS54-like [Mercenaria mercenaria]
MRTLYGIIAVFVSTALYAEAGTVYKTIIKNGTGPVPQPNQTVIVHYTGKLQSGEEFDSSRTRNEPFKFKLGAGEVIRGWDAGVSSMRVGERAELEIAPEDGYGAEGYPPVIPPSAKLLFDIELLAIEGVTPVPPLPAFGGMTDVVTSSSGSLQTGGGQSADLNGFGASNMFDNQGFSSAGISLDGNQGFGGIGGDSTQSFTPPDLSMSGPGMIAGDGGTRGTSSVSGFGLDMTETSRPRDSVPSLADAFSASMSGRGSAGSLPEQRPVASMNGPFDFGRGGAGDALFGSQGGSQRSMSDPFSTRGTSDTPTGFGGGRFDQSVSDPSLNGPFGPPSDSRFGDLSSGSSRRDNRGVAVGSRFPETRIPGMDISSASGTDFGFDRSSGGTGFSLSERGGRFSATSGRTANSGPSSDFSSTRFGSEMPAQIGGDTMLPGMDMGMGSSFGSSSTSASSRDLGSGMAPDRFGSSARGFSRDRPFDMERGSFREDTGSSMGGRMSTVRDMGMGAAGSEMPGGMGLGMGGRMPSFPDIGSGMGMSGSGPDGRGSEMGGRIPPMSDMGGGVGSGVGIGAPGPDMSGGMGSGIVGRTPTFGGGMGIGASGPGMTGGMGPGMDGRMSPMSGMGGSMGSRGSGPDITGGMGPGMGGRMSPMSGMGGSMGSRGSGPDITGGMGPGMGGRMSPMSGMGGSMGSRGSGPDLTGGMGPGMGARMPSAGGMGGSMGTRRSEMTGGMDSGMRGMMAPRSGMRGNMEITGSGPGMTGGMGAGMGGRMPPMSGMEAGMGTAGPDMPGGMGFMGGPRGGPGFDRPSRMGMGGVTPFMGGSGPRMGPGGPGMGPGTGPMSRAPGMRPGPGRFSGPMGPGMMPPFMRRRMPPFMRRDAMRRRMLGFRRRR